MSREELTAAHMVTGRAMGLPPVPGASTHNCGLRQLWEDWASGGRVSPWVPRAQGRFRQVFGATGKPQGTGGVGEEGL